MKKNFKSLVLSSFILFMPFSAIVEAKTEIKDLRTEYLLNPIGIDVVTPHLSWKMSSDTRGAEQTAYEISVSTDKEGTNSIWKSGKILSDKSLNIKYSGNALQPMTRYYWYVDVWDASDAKIASIDTAFFETGLLSSGWGSAKWIKATKSAQGSTDIEPSTITTYSIKMDFEIKAIAAGPCFGEKDASNFFMWQFNIEGGKSLFRPHSWLNGGGVCHEDKDISSLIALKKGVTYTLQIDINGDKATTYLNGIKIDENRTNPRGGDYGLANLGFRQAKAQKSDTLEEAYYDNIYVTTPIEAKIDTLFKENFSTPADFAFTLGTVTNGRLLVTNNTYSWQKTEATVPVNYALDMDVTLKSGNAGIIFSATDVNNMYMWSINTHDQAVPIIRRHFCVNGTFTVSEVQIGQY
ncbi:MAG TPA: alpha-rhamnosidase, partial [Bacteroidales bacterium]